MILRGVIFLTAVCAGAITSAQTALPLVVSHAYPLTSPLHEMVLPLKCDADGNLYGRFGVNTSRLVKIAADGHAVTTYDYANVPKVSSKQLLAGFSVSRDGQVYGISQVSSDSYVIIEFSDDQTVKRTIELAVKTTSTLSQFVALPNGNFYVSGTLHQDRQTSSPFAGIYDAAGKLVRNISLRDPPHPKEKSRSRSASKSTNTKGGKTAWGDRQPWGMTTIFT